MERKGGEERKKLGRRGEESEAGNINERRGRGRKERRCGERRKE